MIEIGHCEGVDEVVSIDEVARALSGRAMKDGVRMNDFTLGRSETEFPLLRICTRDEIAYVHYFPERDHPGFRSAGNPCNLDPEGLTRFWTNSDVLDVINGAVLPWEHAFNAAMEFVVDQQLPRSITWEEL